MKTCLFCKTKFEQKPNTKGLFCSKKCYFESRKGISTKNSGQFKKGQVPHNAGKGKKWYCKTCKEEFKKSNGSRRVYCSHECKLNGYWGKVNKTLNIGRKASKELRKLRSEMAKKNQSYKALFKPGVREKALENASKANKGKPSWNRGGEALWAKGENNVNWKGGISKETRKQRIKFKRLFQKQVLKRDNYTCQICNIRGVELHVDHIQSWSKFPKLRFDLENCRTLCKSCHYLQTYGRKMTDKSMSWGRNLKLLKEGY